MAKKKAGEMPQSMINKGVVEVKSTEEMKKEVMNDMENKSMLEMASEQQNEVAITVEECDNNEVNVEKNEDLKIDKSNIKTAKAFEKVLAKEPKKPKKEKTMIYLEPNVMKQFKTLARMHEVSITKLFEIACNDYIRGQEIIEVLVAEYDAINKTTGKRKRT